MVHCDLCSDPYRMICALIRAVLKVAWYVVVVLVTLQFEAVHSQTISISKFNYLLPVEWNVNTQN